MSTPPTPIQLRIKREIESSPVILYMKGTADFPMCGFSGAVVQVLRQLGVSFKDINVLDDAEIRQGIKDYADWPTIPQLYVKGEFIGGCDIVREMFASGELKKIFADKGIPLQNNAA